MNLFRVQTVLETFLVWLLCDYVCFFTADKTMDFSKSDTDKGKRQATEISTSRHFVEHTQASGKQ